MENEECQNCIFKKRCDECYKQLWKLFAEQKNEYIADSCNSSETRSEESDSNSTLNTFIESTDSDFVPTFILNKTGIGFDNPVGLPPMSSPLRRIKRKPIKNEEESDNNIEKKDKQILYNFRQVNKMKKLRNRIKREREEYARANENDAYLDEILSDIKYFNN